MHYEQPPFTNHFGYQGYPFPAQQPTPPGGMPPPRPSFYQNHGVPTPSPSPRTPAHSRRMSHDPAGEFPGGTARSAYPPHFATPPRPHTRASNHFMNSTPLHTPPPSSTPGIGSFHAHPHAYPGFTTFTTPAPTDFGYSPFGGPTSPPPRAHTSQSNRHSRPPTWNGSELPKSPSGRQTGPLPARGRPVPSTKEFDAATLKKAAEEKGIPTDYSLKNWDPRERPIVLLGSVFDANSLGEWVFNWTKFHHGRGHVATKTAAELWDLLIDFAARLKRAQEFSHLIKRNENKEVVQDFIESGERLWTKLKGLLKACEEYMWRGVKSSKTDNVQMGKRSGAEFVDAMFNGEKEWEKTQTLLKGIATWRQRFDVNCEQILRHPDN